MTDHLLCRSSEHHDLRLLPFDARLYRIPSPPPSVHLAAPFLHPPDHIRFVRGSFGLPLDPL